MSRPARPRARDLGVVAAEGRPGTHNAITDVPGVAVGSTTLIEGEGRLVRGHGPIRTGVTVVVPHPGRIWEEPRFAGWHRLNGNGEITGLQWISEVGQLMSPIALTNTHSVGAVHEALIELAARERGDALFWSLPVVAETWDGLLNDINGFHVRREHVEQAMARAAAGPVAEGNVGGGTGMICHGFKGGLGTASRVLEAAAGGYVVGVLVQANHGRRERLTIAGVPVGELIPASEVPLPDASAASAGAGSIIVIVATDAPLLPHQCSRLAQRAGLGVARTGGVGEHWSGDLFLAFSTADQGLPASSLESRDAPVEAAVTMLADAHMDAVFDAVVAATEEAIVNALVAAETMSGRDGITAHALDATRLLAAIGRR